MSNKIKAITALALGFSAMNSLKKNKNPNCPVCRDTGYYKYQKPCFRCFKGSLIQEKLLKEQEIK